MSAVMRNRGRLGERSDSGSSAGTPYVGIQARPGDMRKLLPPPKAHPRIRPAPPSPRVRWIRRLQPRDSGRGSPNHPVAG